MDIKPKNILVRDLRRSPLAKKWAYTCFKVYIADFGIARSYATLDDTETEGPTSFTRKYAAPEVVDRGRRGLGADVFSLGCVFIEILAALALLGDPMVELLKGHVPPRHHPVKEAEAYEKATKLCGSGSFPARQLQQALEQNECYDTSYQANIDAVQRFMASLEAIQKTTLARELIPPMVVMDPLNRSTSQDVASYFRANFSCCTATADQLEVEIPRPDS